MEEKEEESLLCTKTSITQKRFGEKDKTTIQSVKWKPTMKNTPSKSNVTTINQFTDEFLENLQDESSAVTI